MSKQTVKHVVLDLISWYQSGIQNRKKKSFLSFFVAIFRLSGLVPFGILALNIYDLLMYILLVIFKYSPAEKPESSSDSSKSKHA